MASKNMARGRGLFLPCGLPDSSYSWAFSYGLPGRLPVGSLGRLRYHEQRNALFQLTKEPADALTHELYMSVTGLLQGYN